MVASRAAREHRSENPRSSTVIAALAVLLGVALAAGQAQASPFADPIIGQTPFSGPSEGDLSAVVVNPAALFLLSAGSHIYLGASGRYQQHRITRRQITDPDAGLEPGAEVSSSILAPGAMVAYASSGEFVSWGFSAHLPQSESFIEDHDALRYHSLGGHWYQVAPVSLAGALRRGPFHLGVTFTFSKYMMRYEFARDTALEAGRTGIEGDCGGAPCGIENPLADQSYRLEAGSDLLELRNVQLRVGLLVALPRGWWLGASYIGPPGLFAPVRLEGDVRISDAPRDGTIVRRGAAEVEFLPPQTFWLGARGPVLPGWDVVGNLRYFNLSRMDRLDIYMFGGTTAGGEVPAWYPRYLGFADTLLLQAGLEQQPGAPLRLGGRLRVETGAASARTISPLLPSGLNLGVAAGAEVRLGPSFVLALSYLFSWYPEQSSTDSAFDPLARLACVESGFDLELCRPAREGRAVPTAAGDYRRFDHAVQVSLRWDQL